MSLYGCNCFLDLVWMTVILLVFLGLLSFARGKSALLDLPFLITYLILPVCVHLVQDLVRK